MVLNDVFHNLSNELNDLRRTRNDEIVQRVEKVNELIKKIYDLNIEIGAVETGKQHANDSRDKRDMLVKELSSIVDVSIIENEIGQISISSGSNLLVAPAYYQKLETYTTSFDLPDGTSMREIGIRVAETKNQFKPLSGQLKG
jgi:flagellar hook-associated protein 1 FlgK